MKVLHFCLLAMFFSCTSNVEKGEYTILDPTTFEEKELLLSDYVDEVRFIIFDTTFLFRYNPQIQISAESETKRSIFREKDKTKRSKKESAQHSKSRNKSFVMTSVSAL